jgi:hypothetical protein
MKMESNFNYYKKLSVFTWGSAYKGKLGHSISWTHDEPTEEPLPK